MSTKRGYVLVLWGENFDEITATVFVSELRQAGLRVKVVALDNQRTSGAHGLALVPDLTLGRALPLVNRATCIVLPCDSIQIQHFTGDPRLVELFRRAATNDTKIIMGEINKRHKADLEKLSLPLDEMAMYPDSEELVLFVRRMAGTLSG